MRALDIQITNEKLKDRACRIIQENLNIDYSDALNLLKKHRSVRNVIAFYDNE